MNKLSLKLARIRKPSADSSSAVQKLFVTASLLILGAAGHPAWSQESQPAAAPAASAGTGSNLNITPYRLTFNRGARAGSVYLFNNGNSAATVDITLVDRVMLPNGNIIPIEDAQKQPDAQEFAAKLKSAKDMILAVPRRVTLAPGRGQTIRLRVNSSEGDPVGEYRSHLTVIAVPPRDTGVTADTAASAGSNELSFRLIANVGLSIPIIVRNGIPDIKGEIRNPRITEADVSAGNDGRRTPVPILEFELGRTGAHSLYGNIEVRSKVSGKEPVGAMRGIGVYTEIDARAVQIPLKRMPATGEELEITFVDEDIQPGQLITKQSFTVK